MESLCFGESVVNIAASITNPIKYGVFIKYVTKKEINRYGIIHSTKFAEYRAGNGKFIKTDPDNLALYTKLKETTEHV